MSYGKCKRMMSKERWYASAEHFRTEKSYSEYKTSFKKKRFSGANFGTFAKTLPNIKFN